MNDLMSGGLHRVWKDYFVDRVGPVLSTGSPGEPAVVMLACLGDTLMATCPV